MTTIQTLYLCEKPKQGAMVAKELNPVARRDGYIECAGGVVVTWAFGHLYRALMPREYDESYNKWNWDQLPIVPKPFKYKPVDTDNGKKQLLTIIRLLKDSRSVVIATDPDREGELIAHEILRENGYKGPLKRVLFHDLTPALIRKALSEPQPAEKTYSWYQAALARSMSDFIVGMTMSQAATMKLRAPGAKGVYSVGRVQTALLALIVRLERRVRDFKPQEYFELAADIDTAGGHKLRMVFRPPAERRITDQAQITQLRDRAANARGPLTVVHEDKAKAPPNLPNLATLQGQANARFGWAAAHTDKVLQKLYDGTNGAGQPLVTYPRSDCKVLPEEHIGRAAEKLAMLAGLPSFSGLGPKLEKPIVRPAHYDDSKVTAHTAIVPTMEVPNLAALTTDERKLYELVARFFVAAHLTDYRYKATKVTLDANGVPFAATGAVPLHSGWKEAFGAVEKDEDEEEEEGSLPPVKNGEPAKVSAVEVKKEKTKPPKRLTEKAIIEAMENIASVVDEADAKKLLKAIGIGTPATRSNHIETLKERKFIVVEKKKVVPTEAGETLISALELAAPDYCNPVITARWESGQQAIEAKEVTVDQFVGAVIDRVTKDVAILRARTDIVPAGGAPGWMSQEDRAALLANGIEIHVPFGKNDEARSLGCAFDKERSTWIAPPNADRNKLVQMGWLNADGTRPRPAARPDGASKAEILQSGFQVYVPYGKNDEAKAFGAVWDGERKGWIMPASADKAKFVSMGWLNADGSIPAPPPREGGWKGGNGNGKGAGKPQPSAPSKSSKEGTKLTVPYDRRADAKALGAEWDKEGRTWIVPDGKPLEPFRKAGFLG